MLANHKGEYVFFASVFLNIEEGVGNEILTQMTFFFFKEFTIGI